MNGGATMAPQPARLDTPDGAILFDPRRIAQADAELLRPERWRGARAERDRGGRGAIWIVQGDFGAGVLRHCRRGGLVGRVNRDRYLWRGEATVRSFREFLLLSELRARGLNVPEPLAAGYVRRGPIYTADLLTALIEDACTLAQVLAEALPALDTWGRIGATVARFHAQGAFHADLNAHNVMLDHHGEVWLIDFDRGELRPPAQDWSHANLQRLLRSLHKLGAERHAGFATAWTHLLKAYASESGVSE